MQEADLSKLRDATAELEEQIRQRKLTERADPEPSVPPAPAPTLAQQIQLLRDEIAAFRSEVALDKAATRERIDAAAQVVRGLIGDVKALKQKPSVNGTPHKERSR